MLTVQRMFGARTVAPGIGQGENGLVKAGDGAVDASHGTQVLLVLHRGLLKPSMQSDSLVFKLPTSFIAKKNWKELIIR